jgi:hypothetical protein
VLRVPFARNALATDRLLFFPILWAVGTAALVEWVWVFCQRPNFVRKRPTAFVRIFIKRGYDQESGSL